ncbi:multiple myeloma tumor-associated protein 2 homolog [Stegodyphus dumicola]|uniref:multiple myeloma tumor-associated protein 2 homolog n=1 Tax=Stegodyphus dumicola TaxID=202533 RepID=UPI0015AB9112|nr:multiple myeloma tumor-associated protein 2 homolog [Stegodyphus dumicola]
MYNPSRGGVRGGADQFTWESVKTDKHRENYLGHSLKAPVGRWQKGKDLSWYAKERKNESLVQAEKSELAAIKKAEEEAMLIALHGSEMSEALRRNVGVRDELNIERVDGVGTSSRRAALMTGIGKNANHKNEGVVFESPKPKTEVVSNASEKGEDYNAHKKKKSKKSSKKHKKEKKAKKCHKDSDDSEYSSDSEPRIKCKKSKRSFDTNEYESSKSRKSPPKREKVYRKHHSQSSENYSYSHSKSRIIEKSKHNYTKRQRHDSTDSDS